MPVVALLVHVVGVGVLFGRPMLNGTVGCPGMVAAVMVRICRIAHLALHGRVAASPPRTRGRLARQPHLQTYRDSVLYE